MEILSRVAITFLQFFSRYCLTGSKRAIVSADSKYFQSGAPSFFRAAMLVFLSERVSMVISLCMHHIVSLSIPPSTKASIFFSLFCLLFGFRSSSSWMFIKDSMKGLFPFFFNLKSSYLVSCSINDDKE